MENTQWKNAQLIDLLTSDRTSEILSRENRQSSSTKETLTRPLYSSHALQQGNSRNQWKIGTTTDRQIRQNAPKKIDRTRIRHQSSAVHTPSTSSNLHQSIHVDRNTGTNYSSGTRSRSIHARHGVSQRIPTTKSSGAHPDRDRLDDNWIHRAPPRNEPSTAVLVRNLRTDSTLVSNRLEPHQRCLRMGIDHGTRRFSLV